MTGAPAGIAEDLETARRRMQHLAPWHVAPLPQTQIAQAGAAAASVGATERARRRRPAPRTKIRLSRPDRRSGTC